MKKLVRRGEKWQPRGFTLIEISLSLVFIGTLSLIVAFLIANIVSSYRRGLVLKQINTVGMDVVDDMRAAVQNSSTKSITSDCNIVYDNTAQILACEGGGAKNFVTQTKVASKIELKAGSEITNIPVVGIFCSGTYSYIWNSGYYFTTKKSGYPKITGVDMAKFRYSVSGTKKTLTDFRLLKIRDDDRAVCITATKNNFTGSANSMIDISDSYKNIISSTEEPIDLLKSNVLTEANDTGLAFYDLTISATADSMAFNSLFYAASFVLGTTQGGVNVKATGNLCATPNDYLNENLDYCAINKFNFAARAMGE